MNYFILYPLISFTLLLFQNIQAQVIHSSEKGDFKLVVDAKKEGIIIFQLENLRTEKEDILWVVDETINVKSISDAFYDSTYCSFIMRTEGLTQYVLLAKVISEWKVVGGEIIWIHDRPRAAKPEGAPVFMGAKLIDGYTLLISQDKGGEPVSKIHLYDSSGNIKILEQTGYEKSKYNKKE